MAADPVLEAAWSEAYDGGLASTHAEPELVATVLDGSKRIADAAEAASGSLGVADTADGISLVTHLLHAGLLIDTGEGVTVEAVAASLHFG